MSGQTADYSAICICVPKTFFGTKYKWQAIAVRNAMIKVSRLWSNAKVPYEFVLYLTMFTVCNCQHDISVYSMILV